MIDHYATSWRNTVVQNPGVKAKVRRMARRWMLHLQSMLDHTGDATFLRCLACHYVFDDQREEFSKIIKMLKNRGEFIDTRTCLSMVRGQRPIDGRYFHLSFDDGFKNVITNALPILSEANVPMILFVPSAWVGADWETARHYSMDIALYRQVVEMATWDDLQQMIREGFEVGSHTETHARLSSLSTRPDQLRKELAGSKQTIEKMLGTRCETIAYPYGKPGDYDDVTLAATHDAGYEAGFCIHRGTVSPDKTPRLMIPRHHFEPEWPVGHIRYFANGKMEKRWTQQIEAADVGGNLRNE